MTSVCHAAPTELVVFHVCRFKMNSQPGASFAGGFH
jgi:hypothetical protein